MPRTALSESEVAGQRERICEAAYELFRRGGIDAVTLRAIAAELGWSYTTAYRYFDSKDDIITVLRARAFTRFGETLHSAIEGIDDPIDALRALTVAYVEGALAEPGMYRLMVDMRQGHDTQNAELDAAKNGALDSCRILLRRAMDTGLLPAATDVNAMAHVFWSGAHGLVSLHLADQLVLGCSIEELIEPLMHALIRGSGIATAQV